MGDVSRVAALTGQYRTEQVENGSLLLLDFVGGAHASFQDSVIPGSVPRPGSGVVRFDAVLNGELGVLNADMYGEVHLSTLGGWEVQTTLPTWDEHYAFLRIYTCNRRGCPASRSPGTWVSVAHAGTA